MHSTTISEVLKTDADGVLSYIPQDLHQYLVDIEKPQDIYRHTNREHDRRIRLLLRRFTNQIQYGCTNTSCNVPTCLSYRKRVSAGPLRPHTDLTARALAVKCLEQYATHGRDLARYPSRDKAKKKHITQNSDGLCWSEPVLPWYADPNVYFARRRAIARRPSFEERRLPDLTTRTAPDTIASQPRTGIHKPSQDLTSHGTSEQSSRLNCKESLSQPDLLKKDSLSPQSQTNSTSGAGSPTHVNAYMQQAAITRADDSRRDYDHASLPQSLFKHPKLQDLSVSNTQSSSSGETIQEEQEVEGPLNSADHPANIGRITLGRGLVQSHRPTTTFRILPPKAVQWLRDTFVKYRAEDDRVPENLQAFLDQCLFFVIGNPKRLLQSASTWDDPKHIWKNSNSPRDNIGSQVTLPTPRAVTRICDMIAQCCNELDDHSHIIVHALHTLRNSYVLPHYLKQFGNPITTSKGRQEFLSNSEIAHIILIVLGMIPSSDVNQQMQISNHVDNRIKAMRFEHDFPKTDAHTVTPPFEARGNAAPSLYEALESLRHNTSSCRLCESVADLVSHRIAIDSAAKALRSKNVESEHGHDIVSEILSLVQSSLDDISYSPRHESRASQILVFMQTVLFLKWDRTPIVRRTGPVGGALEILKGLFIRRTHLSLDEDRFCIGYIPAALDEVEMPFEWLSFKPDAARMHILQFSFLFPPKVIVRYFRSLNLKIMKQSHEKAMAVYTNGRTQLLHRAWRVANIDEVLNLTRSHMARYFVMTIRRSDILEDAIGQIWQRERRELLRPLKVTLGKEEGESGLDHGGVQQEFFRLAFAQAFDPSYGMFDIDPTTHMTWFKPGSLEPTYKYETLGILMSLAIYNGVTVPVTMPLAFYRKVLGLKVKKVEHIDDGWPELAQSFSQLLAWADGDVEDVMALTYDFSYDVFGKTVTIDMSNDRAKASNLSNPERSSKGKERASSLTSPDLKPVRPPHETNHYDSPTAHDDSDTNEFLKDLPTTSTPVTNANREAFVRCYIDHLTNITVKSQFDAFLKGLHTLLSPTALSLFTPSHLRLLFEGHPTSHAISVPSWRAATKYEDFAIDEPLIIWFWEILENDFSQTQMRKLLEFVTASNRLPVGGWEGVTFIVQRNGGGDDRLPGSSTCYGRLLLPEYSCKEVLKERLTKAVEEGLGFGMI